MNEEEGGLPQQIEALVDLLRSNKDQSLSLADIASVTEVLIASMRSFFKQIDTQIYRECRAMSEYILNARSEIASLQPKNLEDARIPRAGMELDAIVGQTEDATNTIMEAAEAIMAADPNDSEAYPQLVQDEVMKIFEACSFQDITGQRISKVVETLSYVEQRVFQLRDLLGVTDQDVEASMSREEKKTGDAALLRGPALEGEGIDQTDVDALMTEAPTGGPPSGSEASDKTDEDEEGRTSQSDIDALFG